MGKGCKKNFSYINQTGKEDYTAITVSNVFG